MDDKPSQMLKPIGSDRALVVARPSHIVLPDPRLRPVWLRAIFKIPVLGWALECAMTDIPVVRRTGLMTLVLVGLVLPLMIGQPALVFLSMLAALSMYSGYLVSR